MLTFSEEETWFTKRLEELLMRAETRCQMQMTDFLQPRMQLVAEQYLRGAHATRYLFWGGFPQAERCRLLLFDPYGEMSPDAAEISLLRFTGRFEFVSVSHRDFLGAVMSMGLRREKLGDLLVREQGFDLFAEKEAAAYLLRQPLKVKQVPLTVRELALADFAPPEIQVKELHIMVPSMRLDAVLAGAYHLSRSDALELVRSGRVQVNHSEVTQKDHILRENDLISCRGKGRLRIGALSGETSKGKLRVCVLKYI